MKYLLSTFTTLIAVAMFAIASPVLAQTPDGETPANEGICDPLHEDGITKGLYGLCVAYCEAQDAHLLSIYGDPDDLSVSGRRILDNYRKKMNAGDPDMPCVQEECPCWTASLLTELTPPDLAGANYNFGAACDDGISLIENFQSEDFGDGYQLYVFGDFCNVYKAGTWADIALPSGNVSGLTDEESASCRDMVINHAQSYASDGVWDCWSP